MHIGDEQKTRERSSSVPAERSARQLRLRRRSVIAGGSCAWKSGRSHMHTHTMLRLLRRGATLWHDCDVWPESEEYVQTFRCTRIQDQVTEIKTLVTPGPFSDDDDASNLLDGP